ncbi:hypothetical protein GCM10010124_01780 [Pilimelia terevasa]|uniref:DUF3152 domain-containing protein n=1 Tax=Pilimelia terevasa TaxID=53372 RepID=A0A8J3FE65_9ACTN|nr:DUF3152 domain-containing protein [Pilimelia terevasa]GGK12891.1 hypothetical protein GCM10010124_01780 [Pilimelia terevasa]
MLDEKERGQTVATPIDPRPGRQPDPAPWTDPTPVAGIPVLPSRRPRRPRPAEPAGRPDPADVAPADADAAPGGENRRPDGETRRPDGANAWPGRRLARRPGRGGRLTTLGRAVLADAQRRDAGPAPDQVFEGALRAFDDPRQAPPGVRDRTARWRRVQRRRQRLGVLAVLLAAAAVIGVDVARGPGTRVAGRDVTGTATPSQERTDPPPSTAAAAARFPGSGPGTFSYATATSRVYGGGGPVLRYRVGVEADTGQDRDAFAREVERILGDARGWTAGRERRFQRVSGSSPIDFAVVLATPATSERLCRTGGLETRRFTNCRIGGKVVINMARWWEAVPGYGAPVAEYRDYVVNHEVGHQLGRGHERCPRAGALAPVMQQQTLGLKGCKPYGWPFHRGRAYTGPSTP